MIPRYRFARAAGSLLAVAWLAGCELALHEVQGADGCGPWQAGCQPLIAYAQGEPAQPSRIDLDRLEIVSQAVEAPHRRCDGVGLACQGRIIGDVLWDQYVMVLAGRSNATSTSANGQRLLPEGAATWATPSAAGAPEPVATPPAEAPGGLVRTHGSRSGDPAAPASR